MTLCYSQITFCLRKKTPWEILAPKEKFEFQLSDFVPSLSCTRMSHPWACGFCMTQVQLVKPSVVLLLGLPKAPGSSQTWPEVERKASDKGESKRRAILPHPMQDKHLSSHVLNEVLFLWEKQYMVLLRRAVPYGKIDLIILVFHNF